MSAAASVLLPVDESAARRTEPRRLFAVCAAVPEPRALSAGEARAEIIAMRPALCRRANRWLTSRAEAEDLVQETLLRALGAERSFASVGHLRAWLFTVLHNLFVSSRRRARSARTALFSLELAAAPAQAPAAPAGFVSQALKAALASLPTVFFEAIRLVDLEEYTYSEAAAALGVPVGTVMSRLFRGRRRLAEVLTLEP